MKRILIIANTYYQLMMAIQMQQTIFEKCEVVLLLSDHSRRADVISSRLQENRVFSSTYYIQTRQRNKWDKLKSYLLAPSRKAYNCYLSQISGLYFDELIVFNYHIDISGLYAALREHNKDITLSLYEEGVLSYGVSIDATYKIKAMRFLRRMMGRKTVAEEFHNFYCLYPALYHGALETVEVPMISNTGGCAQTLRTVFEIDDEALAYPQKYIFFTSVYDFEGGKPIGEFDVVCKVAEMVGKDNLLIKVHPRDLRTIYEDEGLSVDRNSSIPWEAIQLSADFSDKIFVAATSGSVLAGSLMSGNKVKTYYMYKHCNISGNSMAIKTANEVRQLLENPEMQEALRVVKVAENIEDILI